MQNPTTQIKPEDIIEMIKRRRWVLIISLFLTPMVGIVLAFTLPKIYRAENVIWVQPQRVPENYVQSVVSTDVDARIRTISQQIMSRSNLERIIEDFGLFAEPEYENMYIEDKIESLREDIAVEFIVDEDGERNRRSRDAPSETFSISFKGKDPKKVLNITNALTSYVIDENLRERTNQAIGTSDFIDEELDIIREELVAQEEKLKQYREKYMGGLPEQLRTNLTILDRLQAQLNNKQAELRDAKSRMEIIKLKISEEEQSLINAGARVTRDGQYVIDPGAPLSLEQARALLAQLEARYSEKHPDVVRLKKMISDLEEKDKTDAQEVSEVMLPLFGKSRVQMETIKAEIAKYNAEISQLASQIRKYQKRVEDTPRREQEYFLLQRDYDEIKDTYNSLQNRKMEARMAVNLEKKQKGEQFRIISHAGLPEKPVSPNLKVLFILLIFGGFSIGSGLVFLLEYFDSSFRSPEDVESSLKIYVLATVPVIYQKKDLRRRTFGDFVSLFLITLSIFMFAGFAVLSLKGVDQTMELIGSLITS